MSKKVLLAIIIVVMSLSAFVPDPRLLSASVPVMNRITKQVKKHIADAPYIVQAEEPTEEAVQEEVIEEVEEVQEEVYEEAYEPTYLGVYEITAYEWTGNPCANGNYPTEGYTVACNDLPLGTVVYIDGVGERVVEDTGGGGYGWMDLYLGDVDACFEWGRQYREVWIIGE